MIWSPGIYCRRIVDIVNFNVVDLGSAQCGYWWFSTVMATVCDNNDSETEREITVDNNESETDREITVDNKHRYRAGLLLSSYRRYRQF